MSRSKWPLFCINGLPFWHTTTWSIVIWSHTDIPTHQHTENSYRRPSPTITFTPFECLRLRLWNRLLWPVNLYLLNVMRLWFPSISMDIYYKIILWLSKRIIFTFPLYRDGHHAHAITVGCCLIEGQSSGRFSRSFEWRRGTHLQRVGSAFATPGLLLLHK